MNGVIVDDEDLHELAFVDVLRRHEFELDHEGYERWFMGRTDKEGYESFFEAQRAAVPDLAELLAEKSDAYQRLAAGNLHPYPGVLKFVEELYAHGVPMALVTSSTRAEADAVLGAV